MLFSDKAATTTAHELGHQLQEFTIPEIDSSDSGMIPNYYGDHSTDPQSLMYPINQNSCIDISSAESDDDTHGQ
jgi:hypothetical protein